MCTVLTFFGVYLQKIRGSVSIKANLSLFFYSFHPYTQFSSPCVYFGSPSLRLVIPDGKRLLARPGRRWENNIKTDLKVRWGGVDWIALV